MRLGAGAVVAAAAVVVAVLCGPHMATRSAVQLQLASGELRVLGSLGAAAVCWPVPAGFDHFVVVVDDLPAAVAHMTALGFTVAAGGHHAGKGTENALVAMADGTYLELLAFSPGLQRRVLGWAQGAGAAAWVAATLAPVRRHFFLMFAGLTEPTTYAVQVPSRDAWQALQAELQQTPMTMSRGPLRWEMLAPRDPLQPFYIFDEPAGGPPRGGPFVAHPNGVTAITELCGHTAHGPVRSLRLAGHNDKYI